MNNVDVAIGVVDGQVVATWHEPTSQIVFDPQNAYQIGEALARAAHQARYGEAPASDHSYIAGEVRARITETIRVKMIQRVVLMLGSMDRHRITPGQIAMALVDAMLKEVA
jgi:ribosomal protein L18